MKVRNGFVSNSSSSSFVIIGYEFETKESRHDLVKKLAPQKHDEIMAKSMDMDNAEGCAFIDDEISDYIFGFEFQKKADMLFCGYSGAIYVGHVIADGDASDFGPSTLTGEELLKTIKDVQKKLEMVEPPSLITGTRGC